MHRRHRSRARNRRRLSDGTWEVQARVERFAEPALLLLVSEGSTHGYELLERLPALIGEERVDVGNVYRALRGSRTTGSSSPSGGPTCPGPAKRSYILTDDGRALLGTWLEALGVLRDDLTTFLDDSREGGEHVRKTRTPQP